MRAGLMSVRSTCLNGSTLLHTAAFFGQETLVIRVLLMLSSALELRFRGCCEESLLHPLHVTDFHHATPLHRCRQPQVMRALLDFRTDFRAQDSEGNTLLHLFVSTESVVSSSAVAAASSAPETAKLSRPACLSARLRPPALTLLSDEVAGEVELQANANSIANADESTELSEQRALSRLRERDANLRECIRIVLELEKSEQSRTRDKSASASSRATGEQSGGGTGGDGGEECLTLMRNSLFFTPAHCAALKGRVDLLEELLAHLPDLPQHLNSEPARHVQLPPAHPHLQPSPIAGPAQPSARVRTRHHKKQKREASAQAHEPTPPSSATKSVMYLAFVNNYLPAARWLLQHGFTFHAREPEFLLESLLTSRLILYEALTLHS